MANIQYEFYARKKIIIRADSRLPTKIIPYVLQDVVYNIIHGVRLINIYNAVHSASYMITCRLQDARRYLDTHDMHSTHDRAITFLLTFRGAFCVLLPALEDSHEAASTERVRTLQDARLVVALQTNGTGQLLV